MISNLAERIRREGLLKPGGFYLIALSGGCDSAGLLFLMKEMQETEGFRLHALHVNHGLREEAPADELFCRKLCGRLAVPLSVFREDVAGRSAREKTSLEEAGRMLRYERLRKMAGILGADAVLTAHQRDDQAETVLLALMRGSGLAGLCGMEKRRPFEGATELIRPLLDISRAELEAYLREKGEAWREDATNSDETYSRNFVRRTLIPLMERRFPGASERIGAAAGHLREAEGYLERQADAWAAENREGDSLPLAAFSCLDPGLRCHAWRQFLGAAGLRDLSREHYDRLKELPKKPSGTRIGLPGGRSVIREQESIRLIAEKPAQADEKTPHWEVRLLPRPDGIKIPDTPYTKWMNRAIITPGLCLRHRQEGDYMVLANGKKKKLARFMVDEKIPVSRRDGIWLLADGSHVLWVVGYRLSHAARVPESADVIAEVSIDL